MTTDLTKLVAELGAGNVLHELVQQHSLKTVVRWLTMLCDENDWHDDCAKLGKLVDEIDH